MLEDLVRTVATVQARIQKHRDKIATSERRTRIALIDPLLAALGWDVSDPSVVEIEFPVGKLSVDYALLLDNEQPAIFVEAKKLADSIPPIGQAIGYLLEYNALSDTRNVQYAVWTNGDKWTLYESNVKSPIVMTVTLSQGGAERCALMLLGLWRRGVAKDGVYTAATMPVLGGASLVAVEPFDRRPESLPTFEDAAVEPVMPGEQVEGIVERASSSPKLDQSSRRASGRVPASPPILEPDHGWESLDELDAGKGRKPAAIRFSDGHMQPIDHWAELMHCCAEWLVQRGDLTWGLLQGSKIRNMLNPEGVSKNGKPFPIGSTKVVRASDAELILFTWDKATIVVDRTRSLFKLCGHDPSHVHMRMEK